LNNLKMKYRQELTLTMVISVSEKGISI
jgi:hypothetical protein